MPSVTIRPTVTRPSVGADLQHMRLKIEVIGAVDVDPNIFVAERYTLLRHAGLIMENRFIAVAKPTDMEALPVGEPMPTPDMPPFFRVDCIDLIYNSPSQMDEDLALIRQEIEMLMTALTRLTETESLGDITISG